MKTFIPPLPQLNLLPRLPKNPGAFPITLIGAGAIVSLAQLPAYKLAGFSIKGIYDIDRKKAIDVAKQFNIPHIYTTLSEACTISPNENIIFDLAVPSIQIVPTLEKIPRNSHALIQKPMGENLAEAQEIVNMCKQRNIHGSINFQLRYAPYILALKDAIRRGWLGDRIVTVQIYLNVHMPWASWPFLATAKRLELTYHSIHYVDLVRDLLAPHEPSALHCRTSRHAVMPQLTPVRSSYSFEYKHDPMLFVNIYTNHHHRWGVKHAHSYLLVEGTEGVAKAQIGDNLAYGDTTEGAQTDYLQVKISNLFPNIDFFFSCLIDLFR
jgi:predicted dehydrogenase